MKCSHTLAIWQAKPILHVVIVGFFRRLEMVKDGEGVGRFFVRPSHSASSWEMMVDKGTTNAANCSNVLFLYSFLMVPSVCSFGFRHLPWCSLAQFQSQYLHVARLRLRFYDVLREWFCGCETRNNLNNGKEDCLVVSCILCVCVRVAPMCNSLFMLLCLL